MFARALLVVALCATLVATARAQQTTGYTWLPPALTAPDELQMRAVVAAYTGGTVSILGRAEEDDTVFLVEVAEPGSAHAMWCVDMTAALDAVVPETTITKPFVDVAAETFKGDYDRAALIATVHQAPPPKAVDLGGHDVKPAVPAQSPPPAPPTL